MSEESNEYRLHKKTQWFAALMMERLVANRHKSGWERCSLLWLLAKLSEESGELSQRLLSLHNSEGEAGYIDYMSAQDLEREAADVANLAMMIADRISDFTTFETEEDPDE